MPISQKPWRKAGESAGRIRSASARRRTDRQETRSVEPGQEHHAIWDRQFQRCDTFSAVSANELKKGDVVLVEAGDFIPSDGEVVEGVASVNESAITGESAPVIRESGGDRSAVTGGTKVLSDWLIIRVTATRARVFWTG